jgi:Spx/MgsR family transcriptional regulator
LSKAKPTLYGIANCDTVRKARRWLDTHDVEYTFHDFRKQGLERPSLTRWCASVGWETLLNRRGMTWRKLPDQQKQGLDRDRALALMLAQPSIIKRPVLVRGKQIRVGFSAEQYGDIFGDN